MTNGLIESGMRWLVEISDIHGDERLLGDILACLKIKLHREDDKTYLLSDSFESLSSSSEVWKLAERVRDVISEVSSTIPAASISFSLGNLHEQKEDGSWNKNMFVFVSEPAELIVTADAVIVKVTPSTEISKEEKTRLEAEQRERDYQENLALLSSRISSAFLDERALKVHRFLQQELTPLRMGHIIDLIQDDLGQNLASFASKRNLSRFYRSINHPDVFGDESRHITSNDEPPPNPMSLSEAQTFVSNVADSWFRWKGLRLGSAVVQNGKKGN